MKQLITLLSVHVCMISFGQTGITAKEPCTDAMVQTAKGSWINVGEDNISVTKNQKQEADNRLDALHHVLLTMYPNPVGVDVRESRRILPGEFGATRRYRYTTDNRLTFDYLKKLPILSFSYYANFSPHFCVHTNKGIVFERGEKNENGDGIGLSVNDLFGLAGGPVSDGWTINGLPVISLITMVNQKWKDYEVYGDVRSSGRFILIHRKGMLPYTPVTRKQYLEQCIIYKTQLLDKMIEVAKQMPVRSPDEQEAEKKARLAKFEKDFGKDPKRLKSAVDYYLSGYKTDQQVRDERVAKAKEIRETELKKISDEVKKTTSDGLLDSPAMIGSMYATSALFTTDPTKGYLLVTENPDYIRKDLPAYVPQFMVFSWKWSDYAPHLGYEKFFLQDFPIEKIQAMIDK